MKEKVLKFLKTVNEWIIAHPKESIIIAVFVFGIILGGLIF